MEPIFDAIVVGLGTMGSASVYHLAKAGRCVLGVDQFSPPHTWGSSHGDTRITRLALGEGEAYVPLVLRSHELWREIENATNEPLLTVTGGLIMGRSTKQVIGHGQADFLQTTINSAKTYQIEHSVLTTPEIRTRFPQFELTGDEIAYYEPSAGFLRPERCIAAQLLLAEQAGATIHRDEQLLNVAPSPTNDRVTIQTTRGSYTAGQLVLSLGPWLPQFLPVPYTQIFKIFRQVLYWFRPYKTIDQYRPSNFPIFVWIFGDTAEDAMYGFPAVNGENGGVKVATEQYHVTTTADTVERVVTHAEVEAMYQRYVAGRLPGLSSDCIKAVSCLYTVTPDSGFVIDCHPEHPNIHIVSPCSGHGFKHSTAIGEVVAQRVIDGKSVLDVSTFSFDRFRT